MLRRGAAPTIHPMIATPLPTLRAARRLLVLDMVGIVLSAGAFGVVFGLAAQKAHYSIVETVAMSTLVFAGAAQFAAVGLVAAGASWPAIVLLTAFLNARHALYSAALAPWLQRIPRWRRAIMAHFLTDEAFALTIAHFRRLGRTDTGGYWIAAIVSTWIPWNIATIVGYLGGQAIARPETLGLDVVFPAAMAGLAVGLIAGRREIVAVAVAIGVSVVLALFWDPSLGVVVGGLLGPLAGLLIPGPRDEGVRALTFDIDSSGHDLEIGVGL